MSSPWFSGNAYVGFIFVHAVNMHYLCGMFLRATYYTFSFIHSYKQFGWISVDLREF